jgi:hypothetical protein
LTEGSITVEGTTEPFTSVELSVNHLTRRLDGLGLKGEFGLWTVASPGEYTITAIATDRSGNTSAPTIRHVTVSGPVPPSTPADHGANAPPETAPPPKREPPPSVSPSPPIDEGALPRPSPTPTTLSERRVYADVSPDHWAGEAIQLLSARHVLNGVSETQFAPDAPLTRAAFAAMLVRTLGLTEAGGAQPAYADVQPSDWFYGAVQAAASAKLITGDQGQFRPNDQITRQEMAVMLTRALRLRGKSVMLPQEEELRIIIGFGDGDTIPTWAKAATAQVTHFGLITGRPGRLFDGTASATRAEAAVVMQRILKVLGDL